MAQSLQCDIGWDLCLQALSAGATLNHRLACSSRVASVGQISSAFSRPITVNVHAQRRRQGALHIAADSNISDRNLSRPPRCVIQLLCRSIVVPAVEACSRGGVFKVLIESLYLRTSRPSVPRELCQSLGLIQQLLTFLGVNAGSCSSSGPSRNWLRRF